MTTDNQILITAGTGKTGRRIAAKLTELGYKCRIGSRKGNPAFDWYDESTWKAALAGITAAYICFLPDLAVTGSVEIIRKFSSLAKACGVNKFVMLSGRGETEARLAGKALIETGVDYTILEASWFNQNFNENFLLDPILSGVVEMPAADVPEPFIDADDIADAAVASFVDGKHSNKIYQITGPELLSFRKAISIIADEKGTPIIFREISVDEYVAMLKSFNLPDDYLWLIRYLFTEVMDGRNSSTTDDLEKLIERKPKTFAEYAKDAWRG